MTRLAFGRPDLVIAPPGLHGLRGRFLSFGRRVEDEQVVVHVRVPPVAEAATRVTECQLLHEVVGEQRARVGLPRVSKELVLRLAFRLVPAVGEQGDLVEELVAEEGPASAAAGELVLARAARRRRGVALSNLRSSASVSAHYTRRRCADAINLRALNSIPRNKITSEPLFQKVNNGSEV